MPASARLGVLGGRRSPGLRRGVVVLLTLLSVIVLGSMVFYVHNLGRWAQRRVEVQNAADSAALSGAGWAARQLNLIAHHNMEMARLLAAIHVLDGLPLAIDSAISGEDETEMGLVTAQVLAIEHALDGGGLPEVVRREMLYTQARLQNSDQSLARQLADLEQVLGTDAGSVEAMTRYTSDEVIGHLREAMRAMDLLNQASAAVLERSAAEGASAAGRASMPSGGYADESGQYAVLAQDRLPVAIERGVFADLGHAVRAGVIPPLGFDRAAPRYVFDAEVELYTVAEPGLTDIPRGSILTPDENRSADDFDEELREERIDELIESGELGEDEEPGEGLLPPPYASTSQVYAPGDRFSEAQLLSTVDRLSRQGDVYVRGRLRFLRGDEAYRRGPYDTMVGHRYLYPRLQGPVVGEGDFLSDPPGFREPPEVDPLTLEDWSYYTHGPQRWMIDSTPSTRNDRLRSELDEIARIKLSYVWPEPRPADDPTTLLGIYLTDYEIDLERDDDRSEGDNDNRPTNGDAGGELSTIADYVRAEAQGAGAGRYIRQTAFLLLDLYHREENSEFDLDDQFNPLDGGSPARPEWFINRDGWVLLTGPSSANDPRFEQVQRWFDPSTSPPFGRMRKTYSPPDGFTEYSEQYSYGVEVPGGYLYVEKNRFQTNPLVAGGSYAFGAFPQLGLEPSTDASGNPVPTTFPYWRTRYYLLVGVNVGEPVAVEDPHEGFDTRSDEAPAPLGFDLVSDGTRSLEDLAEHGWSAYLAVARQKEGPVMGPGLFDKAGAPMTGLIGVAQARVFNTHSADLWTPMWTAQLEPVEDLHDWAELLRQTAGQEGYREAGVAEPMLESAEDLRRVAPVFDALGGH